jgi:hypothetical protein
MQFVTFSISKKRNFQEAAHSHEEAYQIFNFQPKTNPMPKHQSAATSGRSLAYCLTYSVTFGKGSLGRRAVATPDFDERVVDVVSLTIFVSFHSGAKPPALNR